MSVKAHEAWSTTAPTYSTNVGRVSALSASRLIDLASALSPTNTSTSTCLDVSAGAGAVTLALAVRYPATPILATDISASMMSHITSQDAAKVQTLVLDARMLSQKLPKESFTHVFNTFMLHTIPTPLNAMREMHTVLQPGSVMGIALWARQNGLHGLLILATPCLLLLTTLRLGGQPRNYRMR